MFVGNFQETFFFEKVIEKSGIKKVDYWEKSLGKNNYWEKQY